uniref:HIT domain-containing protein n=1 Tax=Cynoglossus semilaevis TaxID=244447 RepID=A0A3P8VLK7_CYNSE
VVVQPLSPQSCLPGCHASFGHVVKTQHDGFRHGVPRDDKWVAFSDISPTAPTHILVVPKKPIVQLSTVATQAGLSNGYRIVISVSWEADEGESGRKLLSVTLSLCPAYHRSKQTVLPDAQRVSFQNGT